MKIKLHLLIIFITLVSFSTNLSAQQLPLNSQYMFNTFEINPAYAGFKKSIQINSVFRKEFSGIKKSPQTAIITGDMPIRNSKLSMGLKIADDRFSVSQNVGAHLALAYRIEGDNSNVSFGVQAGALNNRTDYSQLNVTNAGDPVFSQNLNLLSASFGAGMFFNTKKFYAGLSSPNLISANLRKIDFAMSEYASSQGLQIYLNSGLLFSLNDNFVLKPSFLLRAVEGLPLNYDINTNIFFKEILSLGASYRSNSTLVGLLDFRLTNTLRVGYAYDYNLGQINNITRATHEIVLRFHVPVKKNEPLPSYKF